MLSPGTGSAEEHWGAGDRLRGERGDGPLRDTGNHIVSERLNGIRTESKTTFEVKFSTRTHSPAFPSCCLSLPRQPLLCLWGWAEAGRQPEAPPACRSPASPAGREEREGGQKDPGLRITTLEGGKPKESQSCLCSTSPREAEAMQKEENLRGPTFPN